MLLCAAATIGVLKLADLAIGTHFNIDAIVFASKLSAGYARPSRIAPNAALCFIMTGAALWLMRRRGERAIVASQVLALATALVGIFAIVGHLYGIGAFYIVAAFHPMAPAHGRCVLVFVGVCTDGHIPARAGRADYR